APVQDEREEREGEDGRRRRVAARGECGLRPAEPFGERLPERGDPDPGPDAPDAEPDDEEVVPLTDLAPLHRDLLAGAPGVPVLEVQVEGQPERERREEDGDVRPARAVLPVVRPRAEEPEEGEQEREEGARAAEERDRAGDRPGPLPVEVLQVVPDLRREERDP